MRRGFSTIQNLIEQQLRNKFELSKLDISNESWMHRKGQETNFKILVVSPNFENKSSLERQGLVHQELSHLWKEGINELSVVTRTPKEWESLKN